MSYENLEDLVNYSWTNFRSHIKNRDERVHIFPVSKEEQKGGGGNKQVKINDVCSVKSPTDLSE